MEEITGTQRLADWLVSMKYEDLPGDVVDQAKRMTLHVLGCSIGALGIEATKRPILMALSKGGNKEATIWGSDGSRKVPATEAAFANGTLADFMDWEDCSWTGHPSASAIPVAMAMGEMKGISGKDYITAVVAGFEGYIRLSMAVQPTQEFLAKGVGWGLTSWQIFAGAIPAAKIEGGFDGRKMNQLFGACQYLTLAPVGRHSDGNAKSDIYHYAHGFASRNGITAMEVTKMGFDNMYNCFDGPRTAYWTCVSDRCRPEWIDKNLGSEWYIGGTYLKHWPSNMWVQTPLEALDLMMKEHPFTVEQVDKLRISPYMAMICGNYAETTRTCLDAQFSIPYCLTAYLMDKTHTMGAHWFTDDMLNNQELIDFCNSRYDYTGAPTATPPTCFAEFQAGSFPEVTVEVTLKDGTVLAKTMRYPKGHPLNNFTLEEEYDHFRLCCKPYMKAEQIERIIDLVSRLETLDNIRPLAELGAIGSKA